MPRDAVAFDPTGRPAPRHRPGLPAQALLMQTLHEQFSRVAMETPA